MEFKDYYKILGVAPDASVADIKREYRKQARANHPDLNQGKPGAEALFKEVNEAHEVLSDPEKRRQYDEARRYHELYGDGGPGPGVGAGAGDGGAWRFYSGGDGFAEGENFGDFSEFFESLFGSRGRPGAGSGGQGMFRGADLRATLNVSLEDLYNGTQRTFELEGETIQVKIPRGFSSGTTLKLAGRGQPGMGGGPRGDLLLKIEMARHALFERRENDLYCDYPVDLYTMILGGNEQIQAPRGPVRLRVPAESQNGAVLRLKGLGMPVFGTEDRFGDLFVKLVARLPRDLNEDERETFRRLAGRAADQPAAPAK